MNFANFQYICRAAALVVLTFISFAAWADNEAKVFPVDDLFYDDTDQSALDINFRTELKTIGLPAVVANIHKSLANAFKGKMGPLDENTANSTFAVSFQVPRATSYSVNKGNGNSDLVAAVTASLYFTNILTGEILTTISRTVVSRAVISNDASIEDEKKKLFAQAFNTLINDLAVAAAQDFNPIEVKAKITDRIGNLLVLDAGYKKGIQTGDSLEDNSSQLIQVVYAADGYSLAQRILADNVGTGVIFHKYLSHASNGRLKPRTVVLVESQPDGFKKEYIAQLFSELVGDKAPLSIIQVDPGFYKLLNDVVRNGFLLNKDVSSRKIPSLFIRLRVTNPIVYETKTNLDYVTVRHYETFAFADIVDSNGRVNISAVGKDVIADNITNNIGPNTNERREVSIKNALIDLAQKLGKLSEPHREQVNVVPDPSGNLYINSEGKFFAPQQKGIVLHKVNVDLGSGPQKLWAPITEAFVGDSVDTNKMQLSLGLPLSDPIEDVKLGGVFEMEQIGTTPRSANAFTVCGPTVSLGTVTTPFLINLAENSLSNKMPGLLYVPSIQESANKLINHGNNFEGAVNWKIPLIPFCVQPVDHVNFGKDICTDHCERPITAKYTLRVRSGSEVVSHTTFQSKFESTDFYKQISPDELNGLINSDLIDVAQQLFDKDADIINFK